MLYTFGISTALAIRSLDPTLGLAKIGFKANCAITNWLSNGSYFNPSLSPKIAVHQQNRSERKWQKIEITLKVQQRKLSPAGVCRTGRFTIFPRLRPTVSAAHFAIS